MQFLTKEIIFQYGQSNFFFFIKGKPCLTNISKKSLKKKVVLYYPTFVFVYLNLKLKAPWKSSRIPYTPMTSHQPSRDLYDMLL